ncbi:hypothetical protein DPMN_059573 [Dreissena polymorpha]|uniref:Uncharacterized protein n=1 Tax=Dreissena polymorpha TaxID=45954 RepID=A0A9D4C489_DREPO|nr:hypothetical protein DPMN_059573 [Dreissena polymorpha]
MDNDGAKSHYQVRKILFQAYSSSQHHLMRLHHNLLFPERSDACLLGFKEDRWIGAQFIRQYVFKEKISRF